MFKCLSQRPSAQVAGTGYSLRTPGDCSPGERPRAEVSGPTRLPARLPASGAGTSGQEAARRRDRGPSCTKYWQQAEHQLWQQQLTSPQGGGREQCPPALCSVGGRTIKLVLCSGRSPPALTLHLGKPALRASRGPSAGQAAEGAGRPGPGLQWAQQQWMGRAGKATRPSPRLARRQAEPHRPHQEPLVRTTDGQARVWPDRLLPAGGTRKE